MGWMHLQGNHISSGRAAPTFVPLYAVKSRGSLGFPNFYYARDKTVLNVDYRSCVQGARVLLFVSSPSTLSLPGDVVLIFLSSFLIRFIHRMSLFTRRAQTFMQIDIFMHAEIENC